MRHTLIWFLWIGLALGAAGATTGAAWSAAAAQSGPTSLYIPVMSNPASSSLASAAPGSRTAQTELEQAPTSPAAAVFPEVIALPVGFRPEGIEVGRGTEFFVGSIGRIADDGQIVGGAIYRGDLRSGEGDVLVPAQAGQVALGLHLDRRSGYLFVAGGPFGTARVYAADTGDLLATYTLTAEPVTLVNDLAITRSAVYFSDSWRPVIYRLPLAAAGALPDPALVEEIPLGGDYVFTPGAVNGNGIVATPNGEWLLLINLDSGVLYRVDPESGAALAVDLGGATIPGGDGLVLEGQTLYVVQNTHDQIVEVQLQPDLSAGAIVRTIPDDDFRVPATAALFGSALYAVNARFDEAPPLTPGTPELEYAVVRVDK